MGSYFVLLWKDPVLGRQHQDLRLSQTQFRHIFLTLTCGSRTVAKVQQRHLPCVSGIVVLRASIVHHVLLPAVREDTPLCMWKRGC